MACARYGLRARMMGRRMGIWASGVMRDERNPARQLAEAHVRYVWQKVYLSAIF